MDQKVRQKSNGLATALFALAAAVLFIAAAGDNPPFAFVAIGDTGCGCSAQQDMSERMRQWHTQKPFDTVLMMGDNIYGGSSGSGGGAKALFHDRFDKYYQPLISQGVKFFATLGNHDAETNQGRDEIADKNRFHILGENGYYWFSPADKEIDGRPLITFFVLNSERLLKLDADPEQIGWLSKSLNESKALWKVVYFHEPIFAPGGGHEPAEGLRAGIEKIVSTAAVQLVLAGHDHFYARLKPQNGVNYLITGGGGRDLVSPRQSDITVKVAKEHHFIYFEVFPDHMTFTVVPASGPPLDQGMMLQGASPPVPGKGTQ